MNSAARPFSRPQPDAEAGRRRAARESLHAPPNTTTGQPRRSSLRSRATSKRLSPGWELGVLDLGE